MTGLRRINIEADGPLIQGLDDVRAVRIEDVVELPFVHHDAVFIHFRNHVADGAYAFVVGTAIVGVGNAQEVVAVLRRIHRVTEVVIGERQLTIPDFAPHDVVFRVALAVPPGDGAVFILTEAHHDARGIKVRRIPDRAGIEVPTDFTGGVHDGNLRNKGPSEGAPHRVIPDRAGIHGGLVADVGDEVQAIFEGGVDFFHSSGEGIGAFKVGTRADPTHRSRIDAVGFGNFFVLALEVADVGYFHFVAVVGVETENRNTGVGAQLRRGNVVFHFGATRFGHNTHGSGFKFIPAVFNDGRERSNFVRIDHDFTELPLNGVVAHVGAAHGAHGKGGLRKTGHGGSHGCRKENRLHFHRKNSYG